MTSTGLVESRKSSQCSGLLNKNHLQFSHLTSGADPEIFKAGWLLIGKYFVSYFSLALEFLYGGEY